MTQKKLGIGAAARINKVLLGAKPDEKPCGTGGLQCDSSVCPPLPVSIDEPNVGTFLYLLLQEWGNVVAQKARCDYIIDQDHKKVHESGDPYSADALMLYEVMWELGGLEIWLEDLHPCYQQFDYLSDGRFEHIEIDDIPIDWTEPRTVRVWQRLMKDVPCPSISGQPVVGTCGA